MLLAMLLFLLLLVVMVVVDDFGGGGGVVVVAVAWRALASVRKEARACRSARTTRGSTFRVVSAHARARRGQQRHGKAIRTS